jgi:hypothetical protein
LPPATISDAPLVTLNALLVVVTEEELVRAQLGAEHPAEVPDRAVVADPPEADGALVQAGVLIAGLANHAIRRHAVV